MTPISLSIVIPAFNEQDRLPGTIAALTAYLQAQSWHWEIRVVDDGSADNTPAIVERCRAIDRRVVLQREPHGGKGRAVKAGLLAASADYRFMCDADLSMPVHELERFLPPRLTAFDIAIGTREGHGARRIGEPLYRHLAGRVFNACVQALVLNGIEDTQCGFKMLTARACKAIAADLTLAGWAFDIEMLALARRRGLTIVEVPIEWHHRGRSQVSLFRDAPAMLRDLLAVRRRVRK